MTWFLIIAFFLLGTLLGTLLGFWCRRRTGREASGFDWRLHLEYVEQMQALAAASEAGLEEAVSFAEASQPAPGRPSAEWQVSRG